MVIHGAIDGHSRLVLYLHCADNNRSTTVLSCFKKAVNDFALPHRIRIDRGGENVEVARLMLEARGIQSKCVLTGSSVHNQRIERLWRDVFTAVTGNFYRLFHSMEHEGILNPLNSLDLYALHLVFLPRINGALNLFLKGWNCHKLRTVGKSPHQIYTTSRIAQTISPAEVDEYYGIDVDGPIPVQVDAVEIPSIQVNLPEHIRAQLSQIDPCQASDAFGIDLYRNVCHIIGHH